MESKIDELLLKHKDGIIDKINSSKGHEKAIFFRRIDIEELFIYAISLNYLTINIPLGGSDGNYTIGILKLPEYMHAYVHKDELRIETDVKASMFKKVLPCILPHISYTNLYKTINQGVSHKFFKNISGLITEYILPKSPF